jgi:hypothetical protein
MAISLVSLPEEILERILGLALLPLSPHSENSPTLIKSPFTRSNSTPFPTASNHLPTSPRTADFRAFSRAPVHRYTPLLTCTLFARIGTALLYSSVHVKGAPQCTLLLRTLEHRPDLARCVRTLRLDGIWGDSKELVRSLNVSGGRLETFDFCITDPEYGMPGLNACAVQLFCDALNMLPSFGTVKHLSIRKASDTYLVLPAPVSILERLTDLIPEWQSLVCFFYLLSPIFNRNSPHLRLCRNLSGSRSDYHQGPAQVRTTLASG